LLARLAPPLILAGLALSFFAPLVAQPDGVLYSDHSDLLAHYLPAKRFLVESWRMTGELPLWCPYSLGGMPFVHDPQVGAFYPPHWLLLLLPFDGLGSALSWSIVLHLLLAGWGTYACARDQGLDRAPALVAGVGFLLAGKWLLHLLTAGHYTTVGLAWLPWALLCLQRATRGRSVLWATAAGVCYALVILGTQPQWAFYAGILLALWTLCLPEDCRLQIANRRLQIAICQRISICNLKSAICNFLPRLALGLWAALVAVALSAVQLLPTLEAAALSTRAGGVPTEDVLGGGMRALLFLVGPALTTEPANLAWEDRGGFGLLWLVAASLAPIACRGTRFQSGRANVDTIGTVSQDRSGVCWQAGVCLVLILFGLGGAVLVRGLPGFSLFRQPTRMLLIASLPVALLAGSTTQALLRGDMDSARCRRVFVRVVAAVAILVGGFAVRQFLQGRTIAFHGYWVTLAVTIPLAYWVLSTQNSAPGVRRLSQGFLAYLWIVLLVVDLWAITWPLVTVQKESEVYAPSSSVTYLLSQLEKPCRVLDVDCGNEASPLGRGAPLALRYRLEAVRGYNPLDVRRYKEYVQRIAGDDEPLRPFEHPLACPIVGDFPLNNRALLDLLGVRYLLQPRDALPPEPGWRMVCDDPAPAAFDVVAGGRRALAPYCVYENQQVLPRVFVVSSAVVGDDISAVDFRRVVVLEESLAEVCATTEPGYWSVSIEDYQPNRVSIAATGTAPGWLVLTDVWYPGWTCTVDGATTEVIRGDFLFRSVHLDAGRHEVVFRFEPNSYRRGRVISLVALAFVAGLLLVQFVSRPPWLARCNVT
jgi:hypothetical protein